MRKRSYKKAGEVILLFVVIDVLLLQIIAGKVSRDSHEKWSGKEEKQEENAQREKEYQDFKTVRVLVKTKDSSFLERVPLETYVASVVPSEMPCSYPEEALKAQAVCARSYVLNAMKESRRANREYDVDDSTNSQVYGKIQGNERSEKAVKDTEGIVVSYEGNAVPTYYYSTSCGFGTNEKSTAYIFHGKRIQNPQNKQDFEREEPWYRWEYILSGFDSQAFADHVKELHAEKPGFILTKDKNDVYTMESDCDLGDLTALFVAKRGAGGIMQELILVGTHNTLKIIGENTIRFVLTDETSKAVKADGSQSEPLTMLPSAFADIRNIQKENGKVVSFAIFGGGYGHGIGMSQNGAKHMAEAGWSYEEILSFFYEGTKLVSIKELE